ncbi:MAG: metalloenzyme [Ignavibacteria bacterium]|nr:metalloenzyme [Ignavibacteria bacterium]MCU7498445.1 metalloenzyme [Ignavibacteria bacterium]MCU7513364.1 metalloenzyme [Ignavibacteria bacterium]MCU7519980.1 metalloenzyme [Ignavibacteria bacterium]MCU7523055.1 metalloenzyme [Ignavibacteria bacterium]
MIFIDGVGFGEPDARKNPFFKLGFKAFTEVFGAIPSLNNQTLTAENGIFLFPTDARLGVDGLPQSGTGQTSIFCGFNAPKVLGQHFGPYPYSTLIPLIKEKNIFREFLDRKLEVNFVNAYPKIFFDYLASGKQRLSATTLCCRLSGLRLHDYEDLKEGKALSAEIDNSRWVTKLGYDLPVIEPESAAERLMGIASHNSFTLYEYFLTDHLGHGRNADTFEETMHTLDRFLYHILKNFPEDMTLVICSDHGNLEDISVKSHTLNPSITITAGKYAWELSEKIKDLTDIKPAILDLYG